MEEKYRRADGQARSLCCVISSLDVIKRPMPVSNRFYFFTRLVKRGWIANSDIIGISVKIFVKGVKNRINLAETEHVFTRAELSDFYTQELILLLKTISDGYACNARNMLVANICQSMRTEVTAQ